MAVTNKIGLAAVQNCYVALETTKGTAVYPSDVDTVIASAGYIEMSQNITFTDSEEVVNSRDVLDRFQDQTSAGTWSMPIYLRPSGTAGSVPMGDILYQTLMGTKTVVGGTSVTYSQALEKPSFTLWSKRGHTLFFATGATVSQCTVNATNKGGAMMSLSGGFMQMGWAGRDDLTAQALSAATTLVVADSKKFTVGARIWNATQALHNTSLGYTVTAVDYGTDTLTVTPAIGADWEIGDVVEGYLPTTGTVVGEALENRKTVVTIDGATVPLQSLDIDISDGIQYIEDEISANDYPSDYLEQKRAISGTLNLYFRTNDAKYFYDAYNTSAQVPIVVTFGTVAGSIVTLNLPQCELEVPTPSTNAPAINLSIPFSALGSSGEDSCSIVFT